ncbi:MAG: response regulator transcription factor [Oscillospiraceae bacterium]
MYKILIVEDDSVIAKSIKEYLLSWEFETKIIEDFSNVIKEFVEFEPHLVLMDITLPFFNGFHWCTEIRKLSKTPIIFLSSATDNMNVIMAVNMGADDFIAKPFDLNVLLAKISAMLRRTYDFKDSSNLIEHKGAILNTADATLNYKGEKIILTKNEYKILQILLENKDKTVSREQIMSRLWQTDSFIDDNTLTVNITRLRKKLEEFDLVDFITTKKGIGYIIN